MTAMIIGFFQCLTGNHELWIRPGIDTAQDSISKFHRILAICGKLGVHTKPVKLDVQDKGSVWVVPLFSWYSTPEEDPEDTLYHKGDEDSTMDSMWMDNHLCKWPDLGSFTRSNYFANLNAEATNTKYDAPVVSFSHMLPRLDLVPASAEEDALLLKERQKLGLTAEVVKRQGASVKFNFTKFAGCKTLETQIRRLGSSVHVHGHQHRNRDRVIDDIRYISHCLGYPRERDEGITWGMQTWRGPKQVWPLLPPEVAL